MATIKTITTDQAVYTVNTEVHTRMAEGPAGNLIPVSSVQYNIMLDGKMVRFCFDENDIEEMIQIEENGHGIDPIYLTGVTAG